jgi:hypothetical protein
MHGKLHPPQWIGSVDVLTHTPLQYVPVGHASTHEPFMHSVRSGQIDWQPPQFLGSKRQSTQVPEQNRYSGGQTPWQKPPLQKFAGAGH